MLADRYEENNREFMRRVLDNLTRRLVAGVSGDKDQG